MELHHAPVTFGLIVGEGNAWIVEEAQRVRLARCARAGCVRCGEARGRAFLAERLDLLGQVFRARETVEQRTLTPLILVRIQVSQPQIIPISPRIFGFGHCWNSDEMSTSEQKCVGLPEQ
jgi:hypothetical protein